MKNPDALMNLSSQRSLLSYARNGKEDLSGKYDIKTLVDDTKYRTGVPLFC